MKGERITADIWRFPLPSRTLPPYDHTNSYLLGEGENGVLVDCGNDDPAVLSNLETSLMDHGVTRLRALLLTHTHPDHDAGAAALRERFGLTVYAHPLEARHESGGPFEPLEDGTTLHGVRTHYTPGHSPGHLSFEVPGVLLVGDLLAAQGSTWVGVPGGDVAAYMTSLERVASLVQAHDIPVLGPGHGPVVTAPLERLEAVRSHRLEREAQVLDALRQPRTLTDLREIIYPGLPEEAVKAANGSLLAILAKLTLEGRATEVHATKGPAPAVHDTSNAPATEARWTLR